MRLIASVAAVVIAGFALAGCTGSSHKPTTTFDDDPFFGRSVVSLSTGQTGCISSNEFIVVSPSDIYLFENTGLRALSECKNTQYSDLVEVTAKAGNSFTLHTTGHTFPTNAVLASYSNKLDAGVITTDELWKLSPKGSVYFIDSSMVVRYGDNGQPGLAPGIQLSRHRYAASFASVTVTGANHNLSVCLPAGRNNRAGTTMTTPSGGTEDNSGAGAGDSVSGQVFQNSAATTPLSLLPVSLGFDGTSCHLPTGTQGKSNLPVSNLPFNQICYLSEDDILTSIGPNQVAIRSHASAASDPGLVDNGQADQVVSIMRSTTTGLTLGFTYGVVPPAQNPRKELDSYGLQYTKVTLAN